MKKAARLLAIILIVTLTFSLVACGEETKKRSKKEKDPTPKDIIQGVWETVIMDQKMTYEFDGDEITMKMNSVTATAEFEIDDEVITITEEDGEETELDYEFKDDDTLIMTDDGVDVEFHRQGANKKPSLSLDFLNENPKDLIQGEWEAVFMDRKISWEFDDDIIINDGDEDDAAYFEIDDEVITIFYEDGDETELEYEFEDDDTLIIDIEGIKLKFERQF